MKQKYFENENSLTDAIIKLSRNLRRKPLAPHVSRGSLRLLSIINEHNGSSSSTLAELMDIRPSSLTEMLGKLESNLMIRRERDQNDMRVNRVHIEKSGLEHLESLKGMVEDNFLDILTPEETKQLLELCNKLSQGLAERNKSDVIDSRRNINKKAKMWHKNKSHKSHKVHHRSNALKSETETEKVQDGE